MPSVSVTTTYQYQPIGMNLAIKERFEDGVLKNASLIDQKQSECCCRTSYSQISAEDIDPNTEVQIKNQFPRFSSAVDTLIEDRRKYLAAQQAKGQSGGGCTLL